eukprot:TRINITY_DN13686_c0_g1_i2.p1 TRINITY_DN13686_c0_g1~~TRINITY_DN13686_c0_g1_i2.p1  ORF type:complete len:538 (-),score=75.99 TRINITY_DN13686_c0_g1_i2:202-1692(-)
MDLKKEPSFAETSLDTRVAMLKCLSHRALASEAEGACQSKVLTNSSASSSASPPVYSCQECGEAKRTLCLDTDNMYYCQQCWQSFYGRPPSCLEAAPGHRRHQAIDRSSSASKGGASRLRLKGRLLSPHTAASSVPCHGVRNPAGRRCDCHERRCRGCGFCIPYHCTCSADVSGAPSNAPHMRASPAKAVGPPQGVSVSIENARKRKDRPGDVALVQATARRYSESEFVPRPSTHVSFSGFEERLSSLIDEPPNLSPSAECPGQFVLVSSAASRMSVAAKPIAEVGVSNMEEVWEAEMSKLTGRIDCLKAKLEDVEKRLENKMSLEKPQVDALKVRLAHESQAMKAHIANLDATLRVGLADKTRLEEEMLLLKTQFGQCVDKVVDVQLVAHSSLHTETQPVELSNMLGTLLAKHGELVKQHGKNLETVARKEHLEQELLSLQDVFSKQIDNLAVVKEVQQLTEKRKVLSEELENVLAKHAEVSSWAQGFNLRGTAH